MIGAHLDQVALARGKENFRGGVDGTGYKGAMDDSGKVPLSQIPPVFLDGVASVLQYGSAKYSRGNWMRGMSWSEVLNAMKRHIAAFEGGESLDSESGLHHLDHAACCLAFLAWYTRGRDNASHLSFDDRLYTHYTPGVAR